MQQDYFINVVETAMRRGIWQQPWRVAAASATARWCGAPSSP